MKTVNIGLMGLGTVGSGVVRILKSHARMIEKRTGIRLVLKKACVRSLSKKRAVSVPRSLLTQDAKAVYGDPKIDILVELVGGVEPAGDMICRALASGKHVVTANKALLAEDGDRIFNQAARFGRKIGFEASVCAGVPIIKAIQDGLVSNNISHFFGILNGTCNFILTKMASERMDFEHALSLAQAKGYAEKNPKLDIEGVDTAHKLAVLARLAFGKSVPFHQIQVEGIQRLAAIDIQYAKELGYEIKLLAIGKKVHKALELRVHPTLLPLMHPLSSVQGVYNAIFLHADQAGDLLFYGKGAGMLSTASAVMSDILEIARSDSNRPAARTGDAQSIEKAAILPMDKIVSKYYLRFQVADSPGVLGKIARSLGRHKISILSVHQKESHDSRSVPVVILTYEALEKNLREAIREINHFGEVREKTVMMRVER